ncbi:hypothetical protein GDO81_002294 [Engystomops pustulosus]|uniref:Uncharacterized protein n=1 Tax=Engystomops pustulosus TaxID=76066 RepID=A0AAV7DIY3_ENGPU|nr:hypothetical protein GDO81_002294 [Engystomops pustulosus]
MMLEEPLSCKVNGRLHYKNSMSNVLFQCEAMGRICSQVTDVYPLISQVWQRTNKSQGRKTLDRQQCTTQWRGEYIKTDVF